MSNFYKTDYFKGITLDDINTKLNEVLTEYKDLENDDKLIRNTISSSTDWACNAKIKLDKRMYNMEWRLSIIQKKINFILDAIKIAKIVVEYQEQMKNEENITKQQQLANRINFQINKYKAKILEIRTCSGTKDEKYNGDMKVIDHKSDPFLVVISEVKDLKDKVFSFREKLWSVNEKFESIQSLLKEDEYLNWAWGFACKTSDKLYSISHAAMLWTANYVDNLDAIENSLPETNYIPTMDYKSELTIPIHTYPAKPTFDTYQKSHQTSEIIAKKDEKKNTDTKKTKNTKDYKEELDEDAPANKNSESKDKPSTTTTSGAADNSDKGNTTSPTKTTTDDTTNNYATAYNAAKEKGLSDQEAAKFAKYYSENSSNKTPYGAAFEAYKKIGYSDQEAAKKASEISKKLTVPNSGSGDNQNARDKGYPSSMDGYGNNGNNNSDNSGGNNGAPNDDKKIDPGYNLGGETEYANTIKNGIDKAKEYANKYGNYLKPSS